MSMTLNKDKHIKTFIFKNKPIKENNFYFLLVFLLITGFLTELLVNYSYKLEQKKYRVTRELLFVVISTIFTFFMSWSLMMLSMTSNVYILGVIVAGKVVGKIVSLKLFGTSRNKCCM